MTEFEYVKKVLEEYRFSYVDDQGNKKTTRDLQKYVLDILKKKIKNFDWNEELKKGSNNDKFDIFGIYEKDKKIVIIEFDTHRADQISKKFVSRLDSVVNNLDKSILYVIYCYTGTPSNNISEAKKYIKYCKNIAKEFGIEVADYHTSDLDDDWRAANDW